MIHQLDKIGRGFRNGWEATTKKCVNVGVMAVSFLAENLVQFMTFNVSEECLG